MDRYVYIMGRGHSGSTVLDALLGNAENARGVGEMVMGIDGTYPCSCGRYVLECSFWGKVKQIYDTTTGTEMSWTNAANLIADRANVVQYFPTLVSPEETRRVDRLKTALRSVTSSVAKASNRPIIVDSSKEVSEDYF